MEETEDSKTDKKYTSNKASYCRERTNLLHHHHHHHHHHQLQQHHSFQNGLFYHNRYNQSYYPPLLPLPITPPLPLQLPATSLLPQNHNFRSKTHFQKPSWNQKTPSFASSSDTQTPLSTVSQAPERPQERPKLPIRREGEGEVMTVTPKALAASKRPDSGGLDGSVIPLLANHFLVQFDSSQRIFHYDVDISPQPSKEIARMIKQKMVKDNQGELSGALPAFDGRKNLYSPLEFQNDKLEFFVSLPIPTTKGLLPLEKEEEKCKHFRVNIKLVSKLNGQELSKYLSKEEDVEKNVGCKANGAAS